MEGPAPCGQSPPWPDGTDGRDRCAVLTSICYLVVTTLGILLGDREALQIVQKQKKAGLGYIMWRDCITVIDTGR